MTTDHNNLPDDGEHQTEGEWTSNEPPVDDFGDNAADSTTTTEESDPSHEEQMEQEAPRKKSKFPLLIALGTIGVIGVAAIAYLQTHSASDEAASILDAAQKSTAPTTAPHFASTPAQPTEAIPAAPATNSNDVTPKTGYSAPSATPDTSPQTASSSTAPGGMMQPNGPGPAAPTVDTASAPAPSSMPQQPAPAATPPDATAEQPLATPPAASTGAPPASKDVQDARSIAMQAHVDSLQNALNDATQQINSLNAKLASANQQPAAPDTAAQNKINKLEQKIQELEQQQYSPTKASVSSNREKPRKAHVKKEAPKKAAAPAPKAQWVLRAATPGEAWVSNDEKSKDLRPVHVGDELSGLGKVKEIKQDGAAWVVVGTKGSLR